LKAIIGIIGFAVMIAVYILLKKGSRTARRALNQKVFLKSTYAKQQELTGHSWRFHSSANAEEIMEAIQKFANRYQSDISDKYRIRVKERSDTKMVLTYGQKNVSAFTSELVFETTDGKRSADYKVLDWLTFEGVAPSANVMELLLDVVKDAFIHIDSETQIEKTAKQP
jgi:head-tail adaptor